MPRNPTPYTLNIPRDAVSETRAGLPRLFIKPQKGVYAKASESAQAAQNPLGISEQGLPLLNRRPFFAPARKTVEPPQFIIEESSAARSPTSQASSPRESPLSLKRIRSLSRLVGTTSFGRRLSSTSFGESSTARCETPMQKRFYDIAFSADEADTLLTNYQELARVNGYCIELRDGFIWFSTPEKKNTSAASSSPLLAQATGTKFHVSISHFPEHFSRGTLTVLQLLMRTGCEHFKIVDPKMLSSAKYDEGGREITIYTYMSSEPAINGAREINSFWSSLIRAINRQLSSCDIYPYIDSTARIIPPIADTIIPGHPFTTWRDDSRRVPTNAGKDCHAIKDTIAPLTRFSYFQSAASVQTEGNRETRTGISLLRQHSR